MYVCLAGQTEYFRCYKMSSAQVNTALIPEVVVKSNFIQDKRFAPTPSSRISCWYPCHCHGH